MTINFLVRSNKEKAPRINVVRVVRDEQGKRQLPNLGTLPEDLSQACGMFNPLLDEYEQFQLENFVKNAQFNLKHFNANPDKTERELLYLSPAYHEAIIKLWRLAKSHELDFNPHEVMLTALLNKAKATERAINEKTGNKLRLLEGLSIDIHRFDKQEMNKRLHTGAKEIFKALVDTQRPLTELADRFNQLAAVHQKNAKLKPHYLNEYASEPRRLPLWYVGIAMELYQSLGKNVLDVLSLKQTIYGWLSLHPGNLTPSEATALFLKDIGDYVNAEDVTNIIHARLLGEG